MGSDLLRRVTRVEDPGWAPYWSTGLFFQVEKELQASRRKLSLSSGGL